VGCCPLGWQNPNVTIILLHFAFPVERHLAGIENWRNGMQELAQHPNVCAKICGFGLTDYYWSIESIKRLVVETIDFFGIDRCIFGSNFPVDGVTSSYDNLINSVKSIVSGFSESDKRKLFHDNAARIYRIETYATDK